MLPVDKNMIGFGEAKEVAAFSDELENVEVFKMLDVERSVW